MNLYRWLNWPEYHWLLFFGNIQEFWVGSGGKSTLYLNTEIKRDRTKWVATSLATALTTGERVYTFPKNGIIIDLEFGGIPEHLGFNKLMMAEVQPGHMIFVAKDNNGRSAIGRWLVDDPTRLPGFVVPNTGITRDDEILMAACVTSVFYDLVRVRKDAVHIRSISRGGQVWTQRVGTEQPQDDKNDLLPIYGVRDLTHSGLDRVTYNTSVIRDGRQNQERVRHGVIGHPRWIGEDFEIDPERKKMAEAHHVFVPLGHTFVEPHERGGDKDQKAVKRLNQVIGVQRLMMLEIEQPIKKDD